MMIYRFKNTLPFLALIWIVFACSNDKTVPKPPTFLRLDFQHDGYTNYQSNCGYSFELNKMYQAQIVVDQEGNELCHRDIDLGKLNGTMFFSYIEMDKPLKEYINHSLDKVDEHKIKATSIVDSSFKFPDKRVFGTLFELKGNVASPFQFYLTDSTDKFASGIIYFNSVPNYDSLRPSLEFVKNDLLHLIETFEW